MKGIHPAGLRKKKGLSLLENGVDYMKSCIFIDEAGFHANLRRPQGWALKGEKAKVKVLVARANTISILGAVLAFGLIKVSLRKPILPSKKRKLNKVQQKHGYKPLC